MAFFLENPYVIAGAITTIPIGMQKTFAGFNLIEGKIGWRDAFTASVVFTVSLYGFIALLPQFWALKDSAMAQFISGNFVGLVAGLVLALLAEFVVSGFNKLFG